MLGLQEAESSRPVLPVKVTLSRQLQGHGPQAGSAPAPRDRPLGDLRGGAHRLRLALLCGAGVELKQFILHGQFMPEL